MTIQQVIADMIATAARHPGYPVAMVVMDGQLLVGLMNFEPDQDDWYQQPISILTPENPVIESRDRSEALYDDVAQR